MKIVLLTPARRFIANRAGLGYQIPLGLVMIGGPLVDAGHRVRLIDNDLYGWTDEELLCRLRDDPPDCVMLGHSGSTAAHPLAMRTAAALRQAFPSLLLVYGGVYPSFAAQSVLAECAAINIVVRGEGEETVVELVAAAERDRGDLAAVRGITWRRAGRVIDNPSRPPIGDLDAWRPGWELVDWAGYEMFGLGRSAGMQFSRGCPHRCSYCGQWSFWRRWRHRSAENVADQIELLVRRYGVRIVWFADEHFAADREAARQTLEAIAARRLDVSLNLNMTAASVVRDADLLPLYKRAGVDNIIIGVESLDDETVDRIGKDNPFSVSREAVRLLRANGMVSLVNLIYGLERTTPRRLWNGFRRLLELDPDVLNAMYVTPHHWTREGRRSDPASVIQPNQHYWTYRNQVLSAGRLRPWQLFLCVKAIETAFHLRPRALFRMVSGADWRFRKILRAYLSVGFGVVLAEIREFFLDSTPAPRATPAAGTFSALYRHSSGHCRKDDTMQIALPSEDGIRLSGHAGQASRWVIYDCQPGAPIAELRVVELERPQLFHHWQDTASLATHPLAGTEAIIAGSAGANFVERMRKRGVRVVQTGETQVIGAIEKFLAGEALGDPRWEPLLMLCRLRDRLLGR